MIYTFTLNPALDRTLWVKSITADDCNRIEMEQMYAGGKGVDVSKVLSAFGIANKAMGFVGGFAGEELEGLLINEGIACDFVRIAGGTRTNIIVNDMAAGTQTLFNAKGPAVTAYELMQLIHRVEGMVQPEFVVISGSLPQGVNPEIYRKIIEIAKGKGAKVVLDTDGEAFKIGMLGGPHIIKPNTHELSRIVGRPLEHLNDIIDAAREVRADGLETVLVSMGCCGMLMINGQGQLLARPPEVEVKNTIGAGDSAVAGFIFGLLTTGDPKKALCHAVAAGTATILQTGTALCKKEDFDRLLPSITLEEF